MFKRKFLIEVEFTQEEMQTTADTYGVSIEQLTDDQIRQCFENALAQEFEGIILMPADLTSA